MKRAVMIALVMFAAWLLPQAAHAAASVLTIDTCGSSSHEKWEYTVKVVDCVETSVRTAVTTTMGKLSDYMAPVIGAMMTLAIAVLAMRMMGGEDGMRATLMGFTIRAVLVTVFAVNLGGYSSSVFEIETQMINLVSGGNSPWATIDKILGTLLGVGEDPLLDISKGLIGIIGAGLLSSTPVGIMAFIAMSAIINLLMFIYRVVFTYLTAIVMIGFLLAVSPLVIPMALFVTHGERFFTKWLDILLSAMLTPILLFAFLSIFLNGFQTPVNEVLKLLQCGKSATCDISPDKLNFKHIQKTNVPPGSWLVPTDPSYATVLKNKTGQTDFGTPAVQSNIAPALRRANQVNLTPRPTIDLGPDTARIGQELIYQFLALWIFASFMKSLVERVPDLATNIAEAASYVSMAPSAGEQKIESGLRAVQTAVTGRKL